jgi:aryl-alcohol dehydrogenase-like predicted oxidoreductase
MPNRRRVDAAGTAAIVHHALDLGVTFFDTADTYGRRGGGEPGLSETYLGQALGVRRQDVVLTTKRHGRVYEAPLIPPQSRKQCG